MDDHYRKRQRTERMERRHDFNEKKAAAHKTRTVTCDGRCRWHRGNDGLHCPLCHCTFLSGSAFQSHQSRGGPCRDPLQMEALHGSRGSIQDHDGHQTYFRHFITEHDATQEIA